MCMRLILFTGRPENDRGPVPCRHTCACSHPQLVASHSTMPPHASAGLLRRITSSPRDSCYVYSCGPPMMQQTIHMLPESLNLVLSGKALWHPRCYSSPQRLCWPRQCAAGTARIGSSTHEIQSIIPFHCCTATLQIMGIALQQPAPQALYA